MVDYNVNTLSNICSVTFWVKLMEYHVNQQKQILKINTLPQIFNVYSKSEQKDILYCFDAIKKCPAWIPDFIAQLPDTVKLDISILILGSISSEQIVNNKIKNPMQICSRFKHFKNTDDNRYPTCNNDIIKRSFSLLDKQSRKIIRSTLTLITKGFCAFPKKCDSWKQYNAFCKSTGGQLWVGIGHLLRLKGYIPHKLTISFQQKLVYLGCFLQKNNDLYEASITNHSRIPAHTSPIAILSNITNDIQKAVSIMHHPGSIISDRIWRYSIVIGMSKLNTCAMSKNIVKQLPVIKWHSKEYAETTMVIQEKEATYRYILNVIDTVYNKLGKDDHKFREKCMRATSYMHQVCDYNNINIWNSLINIVSNLLSNCGGALFISIIVSEILSRILHMFKEDVENSVNEHVFEAVTYTMKDIFGVEPAIQLREKYV